MTPSILSMMGQAKSYVGYTLRRPSGGGEEGEWRRRGEERRGEERRGEERRGGGEERSGRGEEGRRGDEPPQYVTRSNDVVSLVLVFSPGVWLQLASEEGWVSHATVVRLHVNLCSETTLKTSLGSLHHLSP